MSEINPYFAIREWVAEFNKFRLDDPAVCDLLKNTLYVEHHDGFILQHHAFYVEHTIEDVTFLCLFGEHMPPQHFEISEVRRYGMFEAKYPPREPDEDEEDPEGCTCGVAYADDCLIHSAEGIRVFHQPTTEYVICPLCRNWAAIKGENCKECQANG
jgi:hypothetical protein